MKDLPGAIMRRFFPLHYRSGNRYDQLVDELRPLRPKRILEIGTCAGITALRLIRAALALKPEGEVEYFGFDVFEGSDEELVKLEQAKVPHARAVVQQRLEGVSVRGRRARVRLFAGNTRDTLAEAVKELAPVDFCFIDGGHSYETVRSDWEYCRELAHEGTCFVFDDYPFEGVRRAVDEIDRDEWEVTPLEPGDTFHQGGATTFSQLARVVRQR